MQALLFFISLAYQGKHIVFRLGLELWYLEGFWFFLEDFLKIIFLHGEIFEFP
jgi:hypothetical protein